MKHVKCKQNHADNISSVHHTGSFYLYSKLGATSHPASICGCPGPGAGGRGGLYYTREQSIGDPPSPIDRQPNISYVSASCPLLGLDCDGCPDAAT